MDEHLLRIGEIAAFFGVSVKAMRVYERMGVLKPVRVDEQTGYRYYTADQVKQLNALLEMKYFGFTLAEIQGLLAGGLTKEKYLDALAHKKLAWQDRIADAQTRVESIDEAAGKLANSPPAAKIHELTEEEQAQLLSRLSVLKNLPLSIPNELSEIIWL